MRILLSVIGCCLLFFTIQAQEYSPRSQDAELWTALTLNKKVNKKIDVSTNLAYRRQNNFSDFKSSFVQFNVKYDLLKKLYVGTSYRYTDRPGADYEHIWMFRSRYKYRLKPFDLSARFRYDYRLNESSETRQIFRQKLQVKYRRKKKFYRPYVFYEFFYEKSFNYSDYNRYRLGFGSEFRVTKDFSLNLAYFLQSDQNQARPEDSYVFDVGFSYDL